MKSLADVAMPPAVATLIAAETAASGTVTVRLVAVAAVTRARVRPKETLLSAGVVENPVPVSVTVVPALPRSGLTAKIVGTATAAVTVNVCSLVAVAEPVVTVTLPLAALDGTITTSRAVVAEVTLAVTPLNRTVLPVVEAAKPVPVTVTLAPAGARLGDSADTVSAPAADRVTAVGFPASS
jgi:hypothetical protein